MKRILLSPEAETALKELSIKLKGHNNHLTRFQNALVNQALIDLNDSASDVKLKTIAELLLSPAGKKKMLMERVETIVETLDDNGFKTLESSLKKVCNQIEKKDTPPPVEANKGVNLNA